jgi:RNA polymerase sigma factor (sigma-70 family)
MNSAIRSLRRSVLLRDGAGLTDAELLDCFVKLREEAAFEALVRRHGPMVLGLCRRVLNNAHDAEDAFQATFLVLVRNARAIVSPERVGSWLYGVAYRIALRAKNVAARRRAKEREMSKPEALEKDTWEELQPLLDQEMSRLPEKYRVPMVLCDLEGKTRKEAARQLGWPEGTLSGRLSRARVMVARRLARQGLSISGGALALALSQKAGAVSLSHPLIASTVKAASWMAAGQAAGGMIPAQVAALTEGMMKAMLLTKLKKIVLVVVALAALAIGAVGHRIAMAGDEEPKKPTPSALPQAGADQKKAPSAGQRLPMFPMVFTQVLARVDKKGMLAIQMMATTYRQVQVQTADGQAAAAIVPETSLATKRFKPDEVEVYDTEAKPVSGKALSKLLAKEVPALVAASKAQVDPLHLRLFKKGTLILVLPQPKNAAPVAVNIFPAPPVPAARAILPALPGAPAGRPGGRAGPAIPPPAAAPPVGGGRPAPPAAGGPAIPPPQAPAGGGPAFPPGNQRDRN